MIEHAGNQKRPSPDASGVRHRTIRVDGIDVFFREAGPERAPVLLLPHGYPSSSFQYRRFMPALADRYRTVAPDFPGVSEEGFRDEFLGELPPEHRNRVSPDLWKLSWPLLGTRERRAIMVALMEGLRENLGWFPRYQEYLRRHRPPTLVVWGPHDGYMPEGAGRAYRRDLPDAEVHMLDGGHWLLETHHDQVVALVRAFLGRLEAG